MKKSRSLAVVALLFVYVAVRLFSWLDSYQALGYYSATRSGAFKTALWVVPSALVVALWHRMPPAAAWAKLGLDLRVARGLAFGFLATVPMAIAVMASGHRPADIDLLIGTAVLGPFAEEVLFRGFLLTQLQRARLPAAWAVGISALAFGAAHAPQLNAHLGWYHITAPWELAVVRFGVVAGQVATLTAGGVVFGWVFYRFRSLWPAVALHGFLNLWLTLAHDDVPIDPGWSLSAVAIAQLLSFVLAIWLSARRPRTVQRVAESA